MFKRKITSIGIPLAALLLISFSLYHLLSNANASEIIYIENSTIFDFSNDPLLAGFANNIFIGEVKTQKSTTNRSTLPETQFNVHVLQNIKGSLNGTVTVNQEGGFEDNTLYLFENDKLLEVGQTYLFVTRFLATENWHTLIPKYGNIPLTSDEVKKNLINKFSDAYKNEIKFLD